MVKRFLEGRASVSEKKCVVLLRSGVCSSFLIVLGERGCIRRMYIMSYFRRCHCFLSRRFTLSFQFYC